MRQTGGWDRVAGARRAVALLANAADRVRPGDLDAGDLYVAAVRMVMRVVVAGEAERLGMFPVTCPVYRQSYSLAGLRQELRDGCVRDRAGRSGRGAAWPRLLGLFRLVWKGSNHCELPMRAYGGELFEPGRPGSRDPVSRALARLEDPCSSLSDVEAWDLLERIEGSVERARARGSRLVGALYEGLTDGKLVRGDGGEYELADGEGWRGSGGVYYTPEPLADGTVEKCLRPLTRRDDAVAPGRPEDVLALRVCDPAMGSGSFLVSALRFLSQEVMTGLRVHGRLGARTHGGTTRTEVRVSEDTVLDIPSVPGQKEFEGLLLAHVRRHVVERCLHGVDVDPVAVELARVALWMETLDPRLPFTFLEHKLKCGNSLVGCGLDEAAVYPLGALRDGEERAVRARGELEALVAEVRSPLLPAFVRGRGLRTARQDLAARMEAIHRVPVELPDRKRALYREGFQENETVERLRSSLDRWCAYWFAEGEERLRAPSPREFYEDGAAWVAEARRAAGRVGFFHWELEFPDVFGGQKPGFDAVFGNPPWAEVKGVRGGAMSRWLRSRSRPAGRLESLLRRASGLPRRQRERPFVHQGVGAHNLYKLFLEQAHWLCREGGRLAMLVPSGLYSDRGSSGLRRLLLDRCRLEWVYGFENRACIFPIDSRYKFCAVVAAKGAATDVVQVRFLRREPREWLGTPSGGVPVSRSVLRRVSPADDAFPEVGSSRQLDLVLRMLSAGTSVMRAEHHRVRPPDGALLFPGVGEQEGWPVQYVREHDMSDPRHEFQPVEWWEERGFVRGADCVWTRGTQEAAPLYQGVMFGPHDFASRGWDPRARRWEEMDWEARTVRPRLLVPWVSGADGTARGCKLVVRRIARNTDERTVIAALVPDFPCGDKAAVLRTDSLERSAALVCILNSLPVDFAARALSAGTNLDWHHLQRLPLPRFQRSRAMGLLALAGVWLNCGHPQMGSVRLPLESRGGGLDRSGGRTGERGVLRAYVDALVGELLGLSVEDFEMVVADCGHEREALADPGFRAGLDPRGFWRVDRDLRPEERLPMRSLAAFRELKRVGLDAFVERVYCFVQSCGAGMAQTEAAGQGLPSSRSRVQSNM